jgi:hypothetical protein
LHGVSAGKAETRECAEAMISLITTPRWSQVNRSG